MTVARHSKQIPMPQRGPRGAPLTERRMADTPVERMAARAVVPAGTEMFASFTVMEIASGMNLLINASR